MKLYKVKVSTEAVVLATSWRTAEDEAGEAVLRGAVGVYDTGEPVEIVTADDLPPGWEWEDKPSSDDQGRTISAILKATKNNPEG